MRRKHINRILKLSVADSHVCRQRHWCVEFELFAHDQRLDTSSVTEHDINAFNTQSLLNTCAYK